MVLNGTFKKSSCTGLEELLKALDASNHLEKANADLETTITINGDDWEIERKRPNVTTSNKFKVGTEAAMNTVKDGFSPVCRVDLVDKKLTIKSVEKDYQHTIELEDGKLKEVFTVKGMSATRYSDKV